MCISLTLMVLRLTPRQNAVMGLYPIMVPSHVSGMRCVFAQNHESERDTLILLSLSLLWVCVKTHRIPNIWDGNLNSHDRKSDPSNIGTGIGLTEMPNEIHRLCLSISVNQYKVDRDDETKVDSNRSHLITT